MKTCETCRFWREAFDLADIIDMDRPGQCCIRSPFRQWTYTTKDGEVVNLTFPVTIATEFCGEHKETTNG